MNSDQEKMQVLLVESTYFPQMIAKTLPQILESIPSNFAVTLFTSQECYEFIPLSLKLKLKKIHKFENFYSNPLVEFKTNIFLKENPSAYVIALREFDLLRVSRSCLNNNNKSFNYPSIFNYRDKIHMKQKLKDKEIPVAKYRPVQSATCLLQASYELGFPFIVKPRCKAAGIGFKVLNCENDIVNYLDSLKNDLDWDEDLNLIAEEYIGTEMFHVDGFVKDGKIIFSLASRYLGHKPHLAWDPKTATNILSGSICVKRNTDEYIALMEITQKSLHALGNSQHCFAFHAEIWKRNNNYLINEIACRIGGGQVMIMFTETLTYSPEKFLIAEILQIKNPPLLPNIDENEITLIARLLPKKGLIASSQLNLPPNCQIQLQVPEGEKLNHPQKWYDAFAYLTIKSHSEEAAKDCYWEIYNIIYHK
ncbi:ATP-grasp domain-containing protein [Fluviispira vulneris]|uniref:ATP-grasp domain-containing protein n=1 Tax=Fluviispira vulneris TaxID=2763012 RepID=UPI0016491F9D|nr:hypothetical protein [Fluviispira vulneris]